MMQQIPKPLRRRVPPRRFFDRPGLAGLVVRLGLGLLAGDANAQPADSEAAKVGAPKGALIAEFAFLDRIEGFGRTSGHIAIDVGAERPLPMLLDTGATHTLMTPRYARALGISVRRERTRPHLRATRLGRNLEIRILDTSSDSGHGAGGVGDIGVIGMDFLRKFVLELDYRARVVRFYDPHELRLSKPTALEGEWIVPMLRIDARPGIEVGMGSGTNRFVIDTGMPFSLVVAAERLGALGLEPLHTGRSRESDAKLEAFGRSLYGEEPFPLHPLAEVRIGDRVVARPGLRIAPNEGARYRVTNLGGPDRSLLGSGFLRRFRVRLDFRRRWIGFTPREPEFAGAGAGAETAE